MTVIAWDGRTLAGDRESGSQYIKCTAATKVYRINGCLVGCAGTGAINAQWREWFRAGAKPEDFKAPLNDADNFTHALVIQPDGRIHLYQRTPYPIEMHGPFAAVGSGQEAALAVLHMGGDARKAVEIASIVCAGCGGGVDTLELEVGNQRAANAETLKEKS